MFGQEPTIFRVSLIRRLARLARIRFAGQRLPYHQNAQTRRARGNRGKCRTNSSLPESCRWSIGVKSPELAEEFAKQKSQKQETGQILSSWRAREDSNLQPIRYEPIPPSAGSGDCTSRI